MYKITFLINLSVYKNFFPFVAEVYGLLISTFSALWPIAGVGGLD
jgi:hypothetical protein